MKKFTSYKNKFDLKKFIKISKKEDDLLKCLSFAYGIKNDFDPFDGNIQAMGLERFFMLISNFKKYKILYSPIIVIEDYPKDGSFQSCIESGILNCSVEKNNFSYLIFLNHYNIDEDITIRERKKNIKFSNSARLKLTIDYLKWGYPSKQMPCQKVYINNKIKWNPKELDNLKSEISNISYRKNIKFVTLYDL